MGATSYTTLLFSELSSQLLGLDPTSNAQVATDLEASWREEALRSDREEEDGDLSSPEPSTPPSDGPVPSAAYLSLLARLEAFARPIELWALPGTPGHRKIKDEDPDSSSLPSLSPSSSRDSSPTFSELSCPTLPYSTPAFEQPFASSSTPRNGSPFAGSLLRVKRGHAGGREEEESPLRGKGKRVRSKGRMRTSRRTRCSRSEKG